MIAIDWGTSSFRAYRVSRDGAVTDKRSAPLGILTVQEKFADALESQVGDWLAQGETPVVMSGMIGSRQGWKEAPYVACPAGLQEIGAALVRVEWGAGRRAYIAPGLTCNDASGIPDVMRGEEVQLLGVLEQLPRQAIWICLPGTHSKWAHVENARITHFDTYMTGEVFAVMKSHSILGRMMTDAASDFDSFDQGLHRARASGGLLHHLFGVRTRGLFAELPNDKSASYLSGLLIGHELTSIPQRSGIVYVLGTRELAMLYAYALRLFGYSPHELDPDAVVRGLFRLAEHVPPEQAR